MRETSGLGDAGCFPEPAVTARHGASPLYPRVGLDILRPRVEAAVPSHPIKRCERPKQTPCASVHRSGVIHGLADRKWFVTFVTEVSLYRVNV